MSPLYGLIGYPLSHSFSPAWFREKFVREGIDAEYRAFELPDISGLPALITAHPELKGLNVTIPHKQAVIPFLEEIDLVAAGIGAVNCIDLRDGRLKGFNTDAFGFEQSLLPLLRASHRKALVLGTGGASLAVKYILNKLNIDFLSVSRNANGTSISYADLTDEIIGSHTLIINTTPLGMFPHTELCPPLSYQAIGKEHLLYDLIYNPPKSRFLFFGESRGAQVKNGLEMLQLQADESWRIWTEKSNS